MLSKITFNAEPLFIISALSVLAIGVQYCTKADLVEHAEKTEVAQTVTVSGPATVEEVRADRSLVVSFGENQPVGIVWSPEIIKALMNAKGQPVILERLGDGNVRLKAEE